MDLVSGRAGADRTPGDQVADVLWRDHVEDSPPANAEPAGCRRAPARDSQPSRDRLPSRYGSLINPLPADAGAASEVHPHHDLSVERKRCARRRAPRIVEW